jgi:hypothetical protein
MPEETPQRILLDEVQVWRHNRSVYPGWLIAPEPTREKLWRQIQNAVQRYLRQQSTMSLHQELELLFELNWKLETALAPLWPELITRYKHVLVSINPFPIEITDLPAAATELKDENDRVVDSSIIRQQWVALALGLLRFHREERELVEFEVIHQRLGRIRDMEADARARWCYEKCLFSLAEMDDESALQVLTHWPDRTHDSFWVFRKAAVLAESGRTVQATQLVESALVSLRQSLSDVVKHIPSLSREGWGMWLMMALRNNQRRGSTRWLDDELMERSEVRRRFNQLKKVGCSPSEIMDFFEDRLDQPAPRQRPQATTTPGFQPGTQSQTIAFGGDFGAKQLCAYQDMRLIEEAALPPEFGHMYLGKDNLIHVAKWLSEYDSVRTQSILLRLRDSGMIDKYLSRHRVAALSLDVILRLKSIAERCVEQALPKVPATLRPESDEETRASSRVEAAIELLSRTCNRETEQGVVPVWELACKLYKVPAIRMGIKLQQPLTPSIRKPD